MDGSLGGPIAAGTAKALEEGYPDRAKPYHGYFFKILKGQSPAAPLGKMDFVVEGAMIGGFALAAAPADYRVTGVKTFIVSYEGVVYQKDLGPDTLNIFKEMELYNPDSPGSPRTIAGPRTLKTRDFQKPKIELAPGSSVSRTGNANPHPMSFFSPTGMAGTSPPTSSTPCLSNPTNKETPKSSRRPVARSNHQTCMCMAPMRHYPKPVTIATDSFKYVKLRVGFARELDFR